MISPAVFSNRERDEQISLQPNQYNPAARVHVLIYDRERKSVYRTARDGRSLQHPRRPRQPPHSASGSSRTSKRLVEATIGAVSTDVASSGDFYCALLPERVLNTCALLPAPERAQGGRCIHLATWIEPPAASHELAT